MALVRKILESVLTAGQTSVSFNDSDIPNSLIRVYASKADLFPVKQTLTGNVITIEYEAQSNNVGIALEIVKQGLDIIDDLNTEDNTKALSANQGYVLKGLIDNIVVPTVPENITDLDDVDVTDIANGQVLAWNDTTEKFENVNQSGGSSISYSTTEYKIGTWIDGSDAYQCVVDGLSVSIPAAGNWSPVFADSLNIKTIIDGVMIDNFNATYPIMMAVEQIQALNGGVRIKNTTNTLSGRTITRSILTYTKN